MSWPPSGSAWNRRSYGPSTVCSFLLCNNTRRILGTIGTGGSCSPITAVALRVSGSPARRARATVILVGTTSNTCPKKPATPATRPSPKPSPTTPSPAAPAKRPSPTKPPGSAATVNATTKSSGLTSPSASASRATHDPLRPLHAAREGSRRLPALLLLVLHGWHGDRHRRSPRDARRPRQGPVRVPQAALRARQWAARVPGHPPALSPSRPPGAGVRATRRPSQALDPRGHGHGLRQDRVLLAPDRQPLPGRVQPPRRQGDPHLSDERARHRPGRAPRQDHPRQRQAARHRPRG